MAKASMNIQPAKVTSSETHNLRKKQLDYVVKKDSHLNQSVIIKEIKHALAEIKERYKSLVKQKWQDKATPIREGVVNMKEETTMEDLQKLASRLQKDFGIRTLQIHMHKDEGHFLKEQPEVWKKNLHAHMVFDWTDHNTGKCLSLKRHQLTQIQDVTAEVLGMERGASSNVKHLNSIQYKNKMESEHLDKLLAENLILKAEAENLKKLLIGQSVKKGLAKMVGLDSDTNKIKHLDADYKELYNQHTQLQESFSKVESDYQNVTKKADTLLIDNTVLFNDNKKLIGIFDELDKKEREVKQLRADIENKQQWIKTYSNHIIALESDKTSPERRLEAKEFASKLIKRAEENKIVVREPENKIQKGNNQSLTI